MLSSPVQLWPPECPSRSLQQKKKKRQRERKTAVSLKKSYFEYHSTELNCVQAPVITWHYHQWTERRWILHSVSSISARLLLRQETWRQSLGTLLEGMSESLCHAAKCWALYCVLSVWAWNYSKRILPLFMCVWVHAFARYVVSSGKMSGYFCICVCLCAHEKHRAVLHVVVCECRTLSHCLPKRKRLHKCRGSPPRRGYCSLFTPSGDVPRKTSIAERFNEKGKVLSCVSLWFSEHLHKISRCTLDNYMVRWLHIKMRQWKVITSKRKICHREEQLREDLNLPISLWIVLHRVSYLWNIRTQRLPILAPLLSPPLLILSDTP